MSLLSSTVQNQHIQHDRFSFEAACNSRHDLRTFNLRSPLSKQNDFWQAASSNVFSLQRKGHLISKTPDPQHEQFTIPSGVAPRKGYNGCNMSPDLITKNVS